MQHVLQFLLEAFPTAEAVVTALYEGDPALSSTDVGQEQTVVAAAQKIETLFFVVSYLRCAAACVRQPLLQLHAWQPVVHHHLPPGPMLEEAERIQALVCMVITDYQVEQQLLLGADGGKGASKPRAVTQAPLQC